MHASSFPHRMSLECIFRDVPIITFIYIYYLIPSPFVSHKQFIHKELLCFFSFLRVKALFVIRLYAPLVMLTRSHDICPLFASGV